MSDHRRRCPGHPEDADTAHFWDALTGLPSDYHAPDELDEGTVVMEMRPTPAESVCPLHSPVRRAMRRIYESNRSQFERLRRH